MVGSVVYNKKNDKQGRDCDGNIVQDKDTHSRDKLPVGER